MLRFLKLPIILAILIFAVSCRDINTGNQTIVKRGNATYRGGIKNGKFEGYGVLSLGDSVVYAGLWHQGKRQGHGVSHDSLRHRILGTWRADTLVRGTWTDSTGSYSGELNRDAIAMGHGFFIMRNNELYAGQWRDGKRSGWGFSLTDNKHIRVGEWKNDRYLGERLEYTADRIYGIDVSRFQHDVGRKHYSIDWSRLRITHLGTLSHKRISGKVDYPVSFCYLKSTEGTSIKNKYYRSDYLSAKAQGIKCGAYHFFSTKSTGAQQAEFFIKNSVFRKGDLPPVLDVEPSKAQIEAMGGTMAMFRQIRAWLNIVGKHTGARPVLYISQSFVNRYLSSAPDLKRDYNVWIARYGEFKPDVRLAFWQLCPDGGVRGIHPEVDINVFNGYRSEYEDFLSRECIK